MQPEPRVFVVDDDVGLLTALERLLRSGGFTVETFPSPAAFLSRLPYAGPACLVLDMSMPELTGLDVQGAMALTSEAITTVFLSGASDVPSAAKALRKGALDFLVKPVDEVELLDAITRALEASAEIHRQRILDAEWNRRLSRLTKREREVCNLVAAGLLNKQIAYELGTSESTVKVHRARVMHKLEVDSVAALVRMVSRGQKSA